MKKLFFILLLLLSGKLAFSQQLPIYSQYIYNKFLINPAVSGSDGFTSLNLTAREQWVGYEGAPRTFSFSGQTRLLKRRYILKKNPINKQIYRPKTDGKVGMGGYVFSDKNGLVQRAGFEFAYSYHLWLRSSTQLSFGLAFSGYHYKINEKLINFDDPSEPLLNSNLRKGVFIPDASFGVYLLNRQYSLGFSVDQLFEATAKIGSYAYKHLEVSRQYYLFGSYNYSINKKNELQPSFLFKMSEQLKPQVDVGVTYNYDQLFWAGLAYRTSGAIIATVGVKHENMFIGYAFDFTLNEIQSVTYGTHEITVALKFGDSSRRYRWLDRY